MNIFIEKSEVPNRTNSLGPEAYSELCQTSQMKRFAKIVNG